MIEAVAGALALLGEDENWEQFGDMTIEETTQIMREMLIRWYDADCSVGESVPTPFWDEDGDVDDDLPADAQPWYGYVTNPEAPPEEITFIEQFGIWAITGFLAYATWEVGFAPAILFNTIAPKFVLAWKRGDVGELIRIIIDGNEAASVDTTSAAPGDVVRVPIIADPALSSHDVMIVQVS